MSKLTDQVVLITGCSTGIGRALAHAFDMQGHRTFATARNIDALNDLSGKRIERLRLDIADARSIESAVADVIARAGRIDIIVNNAGFLLVGPLTELPLDSFRRILETNLTGALALIQAVFPHMADAGSGRIVNIGSMVSAVPTPFGGAYCASKSAMRMLTDVLRTEVSPFGIDVMLVEPAAVRSNIAAAASRGLERFADESSRYHKIWKYIEGRAKISQNTPMETAVFAERMVEAATRSTPPRRVRIGNQAIGLAALSSLPRFAIDQIMIRKFGLNKLR